MNRRFFIQLLSGTVASASVVPFVTKKIVKQEPFTLKDIKQHRFYILDRLSIKAKQAIQKEEDLKIFAAIHSATKK